MTITSVGAFRPLPSARAPRAPQPASESSPFTHKAVAEQLEQAWSRLSAQRTPGQRIGDLGKLSPRDPLFAYRDDLESLRKANPNLKADDVLALAKTGLENLDLLKQRPDLAPGSLSGLDGEERELLPLRRDLNVGELRGLSRELARSLPDADGGRLYSAALNLLRGVGATTVQGLVGQAQDLSGHYRAAQNVEERTGVKSISAEEVSQAFEGGRSQIYAVGTTGVKDGHQMALDLQHADPARLSAPTNVPSHEEDRRLNLRVAQARHPEQPVSAWEGDLESGLLPALAANFG